MTYSIVARDPATGRMGVAVQSHAFSVGSIVPWGEAGVGVVATQSFADPSYGPLALDLLSRGKSASDALRALVAIDAAEDRRQVAVLDASGGVAVHTGARCVAHAGHAIAAGAATQANMMERTTVWDAMLAAFERAHGDLAHRLLAALDAAEAEGGDVRGRQSAAILVVGGERTGKPWAGRVLDVRVEDHRDPLRELRRLTELKRAYDRVERAEQMQLDGDLVGAAVEFGSAQEAAGDNLEPTFWHGVALAAAGRVDEARSVLTPLWSSHRGWRTLLMRLPAAGLLPDDAELMERLLR